MDFRSWPPVLVVDVEGNGATPPDLVEVATVPIINGYADHTRSRNWLIKPAQPITSFATRVHGITNQAVADEATWTELAADVEKTLDGAWIAAHNAAAVEYRVLTAHLPTWSPAGVLDTLRLSRTVYRDAPKHNLDTMIEHTGIETATIPGARHRAGFDATATALLLLNLARHFDTFEELAAVGVPPGLPGGIKTTATEAGAEPLW
jgi:DNA polymerase III epsilon subunit-like protein